MTDRKENLTKAFQTGIITEEEYETKLEKLGMTDRELTERFARFIKAIAQTTALNTPIRQELYQMGISQNEIHSIVFDAYQYVEDNK